MSPPLSRRTLRIQRLIVAVLAALLASQACRTADTGNASAASLEQIVFRLVNEYRTSRGLPGLEWESQVAVLARQHSSQMAEGAIPFGHDGFSARVAAISAVLPVRAVAENVGMTAHYDEPAQAVVNAWILSATHLENLAGDFHRTGVGVARAEGSRTWYFTQIYVQLRP